MTCSAATLPAGIRCVARALPMRAALVAMAILGAACTSDSAGETGAGSTGSDSTGSDSTGSGSTGSTATTAGTTTTVPPVFLGVSPNLDLVASECFADLPTPTSVASADEDADQDEGAEPSDREKSATETEATIPDTLPVTTTIPMPPMLAIVDCSGSNLGQVFAAFCIGDDEEAPGQLTAVACPGDPDLEYPGDRSLRRAAARVCLQRFEETFKQPYAIATRVAQEFVPTEGVWNRGDRRVVCHSVEPPPPTTTTEQPAE